MGRSIVSSASSTVTKPAVSSPPKPGTQRASRPNAARPRLATRAASLAAVPITFALACFAAALAATPPSLAAAQRAAAAAAAALGAYLPTPIDSGATILWPPTTPLSPASRALGPNAPLAPTHILDAALGSFELFGVPHLWLWLSFVHITLTAAALSLIPPLLRPRLPVQDRPAHRDLPGIAAASALIASPLVPATVFIHLLWTAQVDEPTPLATSAGLGTLGVAGIYTSGVLAHAAIILSTTDANAARRLRSAALDRVQCAACGYPIASLDTCPECGRNTAQSPTLLLYRPLVVRGLIAMIACAFLACSPLWLTRLAVL